MRAVRLLAWRRLRTQPLRAVVAALTVGAGVSVAIAVVIVLGSIDTSVKESGKALAGPTPLRVIGSTARGGIDPRVVDAVRGTPGVQAAIPLVQGVSLTEGGRSHDVPAVVLGVDCSVKELIGPFDCDPSALAAATEGPPFVSSTLRDRLGPGAVVRTDLGRVSLDDAVAVPGLARLNDGAAIAFPMARAQRELARGTLVDVIYVKPADRVAVADLQASLRQTVGATYSVLSNADPPPAVGVLLLIFIPLFTVIALLTLGVGGVLVYNSVTLSVEERRRQLAIVSALGSSPRATVGGLVAEASVLGLVGGLIGAGGGALVARPITVTLSDFTEKVAGVPLHVHVHASAVLIAVLLGGIVAAAAAVHPARRALKLDVAGELANRDRREEAAGLVSAARIAALSAALVIGFDLCALARHDGGLEPWQAALAPLAFLVATVPITLLVGALAPRLLSTLRGAAGRRPAPTRLALGNLLREPRRTGVMAVALGLAVGTGFVTASYGASVHRAVSENLERNLDGVSVSAVDPNNDASLDTRITPDVIAGMSRLPGVAVVERSAGLVVGRTTGSLVFVNGNDRTWFNGMELIDGTKDLNRYAAGEVLIGPGLARRLGVRAGGTVPLETPRGVVDVKVLAVEQNGNSGGQNVTMTYPLLESIYGPQPPTELNVRPLPGWSPAQLAATIEAAHLDPRLQVRTASQLASQIGDAVQQQLAPFYALQRALLVLAFVAVLSTLLLVGVQRRRELAMLAAIGMRPAEIARMVAAEAGLVSGAGALIGLASGLFLYAALLLITPVLIGWNNPFVIDPGAAVVYALASIVVAFAAAGWPAVRSARAEVLPALQYE